MISAHDIKRLKQSIIALPVKGGLKLRIGSTVKYAAPHEFGTRKATLQGGGRQA